MITINYEVLVLTVIALALVTIAVAMAWAAFRAGRVMHQYENLAPKVERLTGHAEEFLDHLADITEGLSNTTTQARGADGNGAVPGSGQVDAALSLVRQLSALGMGIKSAVDAYQHKRPR